MATITVNEVRRRLRMFAKDHATDMDEKQHAQQFWRDFYQCFGLSKSSASMFEARVVKQGGVRGYIDSFIPGTLLVEQKSLGKDLQAAYEQACSYFHALQDESEKPRYIITCDFQTFNLYDLHDTDKEPHTCTLDELHKRADWFMFLADKKLETITEESPINRKAAYQVSLLHEGLLQAKFSGRDLEIFLTRLLFCFFADDTGIFGDNGMFRRLLEATREDGKDTGATIAELFQVLNQSHADRQTTLDEALAAFEYINGSLFEEQTRIPSFNYELRKLLISCNELDWTNISPAIFGAMFQAVLEAHTPDAAARKETRRELGAHYTSERNILRVINPLFLTALRDEYEAVKNNKNKLKLFYAKLPTLKFFDPACGCGNFLVIAFRELRRLENDVIASLFGDAQKGLLDVSTLCQVNVGQFYGIEIDEAAAHIARVAMWITEHQLNLEAAERFGTTRATVPLISSPHIVCENALRVDWNDVLPAQQCSYVMGNPPFVGAKFMDDGQRDDTRLVFEGIDNAGLLDLVAAWYVKAARYIQNNHKISCAFVSTNSITQGEQVGVLWSWMLANGMHINFAHRTFKWSNDAKGVAAVHCVIVGFGYENAAKKIIFEYEDISSDPVSISVKNINPYLVNAPDVVLPRRSNPICNVPEIGIGNKPIDNSNYLFTTEERDAFVASEPLSATLFRRWLGAEEFLNGKERWCLWLGECTPELLRSMPNVMQRVQAVRQYRLESKSAPTQKLAATPTRFHVEFMPTTNYMVIPEVSSIRRLYIPLGYLTPETLASNKLRLLPNADLWHFGILQSSMHMAWTRYTSGRLKSDFQYSISIVYNNFAWPQSPTATTVDAVSITAQAILDARELFPNATLADLYNPLTMPIELLKAHEANNKAVDKAYGYKGADDDASRVAFLFKLYEQVTSLLSTKQAKKNKAKNN